MKSSDGVDRLVRLGLWALPVWSLLLLAGTLTHQPDYRTDFPAYARYVTTTRFLASHLVTSIAGSAIGVVGAVALFLVLLRRAPRPGAAWGLASFVLGNVIVSSVFGAAAYAQPAIGRAFLAGDTGAVALNNDVYGPALFSMAAAGILLFSAGMLLLGIAVARSGTFPRWAGIGIAVFGPVFSLGNILLPGFAQTIAAAALIACSTAVALTSRAGAAPARDMA